MNAAEYQVGQRLLLYRKKMQWTEAEISQRLHVSQGTYSKMETGSRNISNQVLTALVDLGADVDYLITGIRKEQRVNTITKIYETCTPEEEKSISQVVVWMIEQVVQPQSNELIELKLLKTYLEEGEREDYSVVESLRKIWHVNQEEMGENLKLYIKKFRDIEKRRQEPDAYILNMLYKKYKCQPSFVLENKIDSQQILSELWDKYEMEQKPLYCEYLKKTVEVLRERK